MDQTTANFADLEKKFIQHVKEMLETFYQNENYEPMVDRLTTSD